VVGRVSKAEVESKVFPVLLYYPELSLTHVHSLETAVSTLTVTFRETGAWRLTPLDIPVV